MESMGTRFGRHIGSFRVRLVAYFLLLSLLPLLATLWAFSGVAARSERARADTRVNAALAVATTDFRDHLDEAATKAKSLARSAGYRQTASGLDEKAMSRLFRDEPNAAFYRNGTLVAGREPVALAEETAAVVQDRNGRRLGRAVVFVPLDTQFLERVHRASGLEGSDALALVRNGQVIVGADVGRPLRPLDEHPVGVELGDTDYRAAGAPVSRDLGVDIAVLVPQSEINASAANLLRRVILFSIIALAVVALLAYALGRAIVRSLSELADAAGAIARGNFGMRVPVRGRDEFARLGSAFNEMAGELETRLEELAAERGRTRDALTRFGEALAATNDPLQLLPVIVESIVEATGAAGGRLLADGKELARAGLPDSGPRPLEVPLGEVPEESGLLLLTPREGDFSDDARELAHWLGSQAWTALENARLHGRLKHEVVTDGLTELPNRRAFEQALETELVRAERLNGTVGLILADLDDFKQVNDRHGHLAGDDVLRAFAAVLRETVREIDVAARHGGEEFAVVLPATDLEGAELVAERLRAAMDARRLRGHRGMPFGVTASFGVASFPEHANGDELFAAADEALYAAKAAGKNRVRVAARPTVRR